MRNILITTIWFGKSLRKLLLKYNFDKIIFLADIAESKEQLQTIENIKKDLNNIIDCETIKIYVYDLVLIIDNISNLINKYKENNIFVNITEGRKTQTIGTYLACLKNRESIKEIFYLPEDDDTKPIISLPILGLETLNPREIKILQYLKGKTAKAKQIAVDCEINEIYTFRVLKELIKKKYVDKEKDEYRITSSGLIIIMELI